MKYNYYNWKVIKKDTPSPKPQLIYNCVLDELGNVSNELDMAKLKRIRLESELKEANIDVQRLKDRKSFLLKLLSEEP